MPLGGLCPLPLPLGGTALDGLTAEQHARIAADLFAAVQTAPFAVLRYKTATGAATVLGYTAQHGVGLLVAPTVTYLAVGEVFVTWAPSYTDDYNAVWAPSFARVRACPEGAPPAKVKTTVQVQTAPRRLLVQCFDIATNNPVDAGVTLKVW